MSGDQRTVSTERRVVLLKGLPSFGTLSEEVLNQVAAAFKVEAFHGGKAIVEESQVGDRMYLIESGKVTVFAKGASGPVELGEMHPGEIFGEIALLSETKRRRATVRAMTPVVVLSLAVTDFERIAQQYPEIRMDLASAAEELMQERLHALMEAKRKLDQAIASLNH